MSKGIGAHLDKAVKQKIYQQRANKYNSEFDKLEEQGHDPDKIPAILAEEEYQKRHANDPQEPLPFERSDKVLPITGSTHLGFDKAHTNLSATKQMMQIQDQKMQKIKTIKQQGGKLPVDEVHRAQKEHERNMKARIQYDHINDLHQMQQSDPNAKKSSYQQHHVFTKYMQDECDHQNFDYHQMKNDLKQYHEAFVICQKTLRK
ncbi:unnamed protein product (macronuclear) [Paramecium tetraurelia]|uniref:Pre-mRNA-splicing factor SYF2 n=1 Tax=Paramecium tetraurelia TaxID=5888 RepID=A0C3H7_PARTE|nr:uncharacterized protein GSPATT00034823001 [Paramecium tetraurelia]CAK65344.1 unnamed protein product [Paramecium tetraurelia]|eukprot:XP_001432741.1 hypothetical protein (macronuclear) [Paramecium tetraurelia strain d4-2]